MVAGLRQVIILSFSKDVKCSLGVSAFILKLSCQGGKQRLSQYGYQGISLETQGLVQVINGYVWLIV